MVTYFKHLITSITLIQLPTYHLSYPRPMTRVPSVMAEYEIYDQKMDTTITSRTQEENVTKDLKNSDNSLPSTKVSSNDSCPLNNLHLYTKFELLKHLGYQDYFNLSYTCHLWHQTVNSAPSSIKPRFFNTIVVDGPNFLVKGKSLKIPSSGMHQNIKCNFMYILNNVNNETLKCLLINKTNFQVGQIGIYLPFLSGKIAKIVNKLVDMAPKVLYINKNGVNRLDVFDKCVVNARKLYQNLSHRHICHHYCSDEQLPNLVLKQWINKQRPHFKSLCIFHTQKVDLDSIFQEIEEFVQRENWNQARIYVNGLPTLLVCLSDNELRLTITIEELVF